jgi:hypothetical protein
MQRAGTMISCFTQGIQPAADLGVIRVYPVDQDPDRLLFYRLFLI